MIPCPKCKTRTDVYDSRINPLYQLRRKRVCRACGWRFATIEIPDTNNQLRQLDEIPPHKTKVEKPKVERPKKVKVAKRVKEEKVRRFDDDDFEDDRYAVPEDLRYLVSDRGFD